jgi:hypothetical protein
MAAWSWERQLRREMLCQSYRELLIEVELDPAITPELADEARELLGEAEFRKLNAERQRRFRARAK